MKKVLGLLFLAALLLVAQNKYAGMSNVANADFNGKTIAVDNQERPFSSFLRAHDNNFMIKGTIIASSSTSLTINNQVINIDSSVTGNAKIVGNVQTGNYAMVQGIIQNGNYYAAKIIVDQRNNEENNENNEENETPTPTPTVTTAPTPTVTPTVTLTPTPTPTATESANLENSLNAGLATNFSFGKLVNYLENFLTSIRNALSKV
jgi:hypothetical protein